MREFGNDRPSETSKIEAQEHKPIHDMPDLPLRTQWASDSPGEAYHVASLQCQEIAMRFVQEKQPITSETLDDLKYWVAIESHLGPSLSAQGQIHSNEMERFDKTLAQLQTHLAGKVDLLDLAHTARAIPKEEIWEHFLGELTDYRAYLAGEKTFPLDQQTGEPIKSTNIDYYRKVADVLWVDAWQDVGADLDERIEKGGALEEEAEKFTTLLLDEDRAGLAISFVRIIFEPQTYTPLIDRVVDDLRAIRENEGEDNYRKVYNYAVETLNEYQLDYFLEQLPQEKTPLIFGSKREILNPESDSPILYETYEQGQLWWTTLSNGARVPMPYINYLSRTITNFGSISETDFHENQGSVDYHDLPDNAKEAIEIAIKVANEQRLRTETLPHYKRLAFWPDEQGNQLYTVTFRDGANRLMGAAPDHHGFVTSDNERQLDYPIKSATPVKDTFMVVPYDGSYMLNQTFRDAEPNFFGPGEEKANAFWIMGNARRVISDNDQLTRINSYGRQTNRFVIVPVRYYQIEEDRTA